LFNKLLDNRSKSIHSVCESSPLKKAAVVDYQLVYDACFFVIPCDGCSSCLTNALSGVQAAGLKLQITLQAASLSKCELQQVCAEHRSRLLSIVMIGCDSAHHVVLQVRVCVCVCVF
jgi:hypothetical protein